MSGLKPLMVKQIHVKMVNGQAGKGSKYRPVDPKKYAENWEKVFGKNRKKKGKKKNVKSENCTINIR